MNNGFGKLYIVATPIGNLSDITYRAVETLKDVDIIAAEDTRHTRELLNHLNIEKKLISCNEHTDSKKIDSLIERMRNGENIAFVSDAGTPIISDPGSALVKRAIENDIDITGVPGPCAAINALVLSGLDAREFSFIGFIPEDNKRRKEILTNLNDETKTIIIYISSHNLIKDLTDLTKVLGKDRKAALSREMTKIYEETIRGTIDYIREYFEKKPIKGEFVLVVEGKDKNLIKEEEIKKWQEIDIAEHYKYYLDKGLNEKDAMKKVASDRNIKKNDVYKVLKVK